MQEQFSDCSSHPVQTVNERLIGHEAGELVKQVLFCELMYFLEPHVALFAADKQVYRQNFLVGECWNRIIAVSLAIILQVLFVLLTNVHADLDKYQMHVL